jgi:hypothetical protein
MDFINFFPNIDLFILVLFLIILFLHLIFIKKTKIFIDFVSVYLSFLFVIILPLLDHRIRDFIFSNVYIRAGLFIILFLVFHILLNHSNLKEFSARVSPSDFSTSFAYRFSITALFSTIVLIFLPDEIKKDFGQIINILFTNFIALLVWFCLPLFFIFAYRFKTRRGWIE